MPQLESINSSLFGLLYGPALTSVHDHWKNRSFGQMDLCWQSNELTANEMQCLPGPPRHPTPTRVARMGSRAVWPPFLLGPRGTRAHTLPQATAAPHPGLALRSFRIL